MNYEKVLLIVTMIIEWVFGIISKKKKINTNLIPYQNLLIGVVIAIIEWIITKDFKMSIMLSGLFSGGVYDLFHNLTKMDWYKKIIHKSNME